MKQVFDILTKEIKDNIIDVILVGSRLYGTNNEKSDYDYIVITEKTNGQTINKSNINITLFSKEAYEESIKNQKMIVLESLFSPYKYNFIPFKYVLNEKLLRKKTDENIKETIKRAKNNKDFKQAKKQLFHAIRTEVFKEQLLKKGKIDNFSEADEFWLYIEHSYEPIENIIEKYSDLLKEI